MRRKQIDAVIFYDLEASLLKKWILDPIGLNSVIVRNPQKFIFNLHIAFFFLLNIKYLIGKNILRKARLVYEKSIIDAHDPKIVITYRDNTGLISEICKIDNKRKYYAIVNSIRFDFDVEAIPKSVFNKHTSNRLTLFTWGEKDEIFFEQYSDYKCKYVPVGSLRLSVSSHYKPNLDSVENKPYDICLVSTVDAISA